MPIEVEFPVGRIVWGHPLKSQKKRDPQNPKVMILKDGQPVEQWAFGVAIEKDAFERVVWPAMAAEAATGFPNGFPPNMSFKYKSGLPGSVDREGKPYGDREGYAGCYVVTVSTEAFAPNVFKFENGKYRQIAEHEIKCGDYVVVTAAFQVNVPANKTHTPGIYVNPKGILLVGYGKEIMQTANPETVFGAQPKQYQLPPGASMTPLAPTNAAPPYGAPQQPGPGGYQPPAGGPPISTGPQPGPGNPQYAMPGPGGAPGYQPPGMPGPAPQMPYGAPQAPGAYPQPGPAPQHPGQPQYAPAHDFVQHAGAPQQPGPYPMPGQPQPGAYPGQQPQQPGGYPPNPGQPYPQR